MLVVIVALLALSAIDATSSVEKLKTRVRQSEGSAPLPVASASASLPVAGSASAALPVAGSASAVAPAPHEESSAAPNSIAATQLQSAASEHTSCEESSACGSIQWGSVSGSSGSSSSGRDDALPPMDDVIGPISQWIKAFKKRIGGGNGDLVSAAKAIVQPLLDKLKKTQREAEEKLEQSNEAILSNVEKSVTAHVLKLLKTEKIEDNKREESEAKKMKKEAAHDENSEGSLSSEISKSASELSNNPHSKSILEHVNKELSKAKKQLS